MSLSNLRLPRVSVRLVAVLMLLAGASLGLFASRALWAGKDEPAVTPHLNPAVEAKVRLYVAYYGLDATRADQVRELLTEFDQRTVQIYRQLRADNPVPFELLRDEIDGQIQALLEPGAAAGGARPR